MWKSVLILVGFTGMLAFVPDSGFTPSASLPAADTLKLDPETGLVLAENHDLVKAQCATVCHSSQLIRGNRFTREGWRQKIRWMQATQNLWELGDTEKPILDYLEKYYSPKVSTARRKPLKDIQWYRLEQP